MRQRRVVRNANAFVTNDVATTRKIVSGMILIVSAKPRMEHSNATGTIKSTSVIRILVVNGITTNKRVKRTAPAAAAARTNATGTIIRGNVNAIVDVNGIIVEMNVYVVVVMDVLVVNTRIRINANKIIPVNGTTATIVAKNGGPQAANVTTIVTDANVNGTVDVNGIMAATIAFIDGIKRPNKNSMWWN